MILEISRHYHTIYYYHNLGIMKERIRIVRGFSHVTDGPSNMINNQYLILDFGLLKSVFNSWIKRINRAHFHLNEYNYTGFKLVK